MCGNYLDGKWCVNPDSCNRGSEFRKKVSGYEFCTGCDTVGKIEIGTVQQQREMCTACSTYKRFWAGSYCYRCDTSETPDIVSDEEVSSCTSCPQRKVQDGKCVLKQ